MKRKIVVMVGVLWVTLAGCKPPTEPTQPGYKHSLKATDKGTRLDAVKEREAKYGVKP